MINKLRLLDEFLELVQIDSPTRDERKIGDYLTQKLKELGLDVNEDQAATSFGGNCGNLIANLKGTLPHAPVILLSAHMDTVEPGREVKPIRHEGLIQSSGDTILGADNKAGIVPILEALRVIKEEKIPHGDLQVVFCAAEEGGLNGSKHLDRNLLRANMGFVLDAEGAPGKIIYQAPGQDHIEVQIFGRAAHAGIAPEEGINAINVAAKAIASLKTGRVDDETTANIGKICGGRANNIVADYVEIKCEARSRSIEKLDRQTQHIVQVFEACAQEAGATIKVNVQRVYDPFKISKDATVVTIAEQAARAAGLTPVMAATGGGSDANNFYLYDVPCVVLGIGIQNFHSTTESIAEEDLVRTTEWVLQIIKAAGSY